MRRGKIWRANNELIIANSNLSEANKTIVSFANEMILAREDCETARKETAQLANRINAVNVLNKVKENLPKNKFKARHNRITLLDDLTKEDLVDAINSSLTQRQVAIIANKANNAKIE